MELIPVIEVIPNTTQQQEQVLETMCALLDDGADEEDIAMSWYDFMEPYMLVVPAGSAQGRPHGVYSCFIPTRKSQLTINGNVASGVVVTDRRGDKDSSSACLAWSETWVRP